MEIVVDDIRLVLEIGWIGPLLVGISVLAIAYLIYRVIGRSYQRKLHVERRFDRYIQPKGAPRPNRKPETSKESPPPPYIPEDVDLTTKERQEPAATNLDDPFSSDFSDPFELPPDHTETTGSPATAAPPPVSPMSIPTMPEDHPDYDMRRVFFGTDRRAATMSKDVVNFGHERSGELTLGIAHITVPRKRPWGTIPRPRTMPILGFTIEREKAAKHFTISDCRPVDANTFTTAAAAEAQSATRFDKSAFIFVHGFNVQFNAALFRCAQMAEDIGFDGPAFLYSWPAMGGGIKGTINYVTDIESADQAATHLDEFVDLVLQTRGVERVHMITHSMGNKLLAEWFDKAGTKIQARNTKTIDQLILAAPDIDVGTFRDVSDYMQKFAKGVTLYACATDLALIASKKLRNDYPRAGDVPGQTGPVVVAGIDTIDISAVGNRVFSLQKYLGDDSFLDHSLFAEDREILTDLGNLMRFGTRPPDARTVAYRVLSKDGEDYWHLPG
ncbi:alpha/beta hydrolase [uncultured Tateyamaria sp.]|uniref:alpha/beta hydrolase n=1 Tax=uncultured Tateyamaria sp. TaxID=455651 RepID=UPI0026337271|nr:alpha/beta hydrolase [uncultured Tateyamaria sp.]